MSKLNNRILITIVVVLLAIILGKKYLGSSGDRNFKNNLVAVDTATVTRLVITSKANDRKPITITRTGADWEVTDGNIHDNASSGIVKGMLASLVKVKPLRLVTRDKSKWADQQVTDSLGTQVQAFADNQELANLIVGKFNFQQATRSMSTSVRLADSEDVYTVEGFLSSTFNRSFDDFRDKTFIKVKKSDITSITFQYPADSSFTLTKSDTHWQLGAMEADSAAVSKYLNGLANINMRNFANDFEPTQHDHPYQVTIDGNNMSSLVVTGFTTKDGLVVHSSLNDDVYFKQGTEKLFDKVFVSKQSLMSK